jgi:hypothetical protein
MFIPSLITTRYVDDTFVIWQHGVNKLKTFLDILNSIHKKIQFMMKMKNI